MSRKEMKKSRNAVGNSSSISIRNVCSQKCDTDTNEHENLPIPILEIEALRIIGRLVRTIKPRSNRNPGFSNNLAKSMGLLESQRLIAKLAVKILRRTKENET
jgi:hypothetical protein